MDRPACIGNYRDFVQADDAHYEGSRELMSIGSPVGKALGLTRLGIHIELIAPGRRTSWPHAESDEEEFVYVLEGAPHVWLDGHLHLLAEGDFVAFPAGTGAAHTVINNSAHPVRLLVGGEASKRSNRIVYPLHPARNERMRNKGLLWEDPPSSAQGPHDGQPDALRAHPMDPPQ